MIFNQFRNNGFGPALRKFDIAFHAAIIEETEETGGFGRTNI